jgi:hypothetical protein
MEGSGTARYSFPNCDAGIAVTDEWQAGPPQLAGLPAFDQLAPVSHGRILP